MGEWRYSSTIFNLSTGWRWVFSLMPLPLYPWEDSPGTHSVGGWVGWSVSWVSCCWTLPAQSSLVQSPTGLMTIFYCLSTLGVVQLSTLLGRPQSQSGCYGEKTNLNPARNWALAIQPIARYYVLVTSHVLVTRHGVWISNWIYWSLINHN
jgi:hypothetical protein